MANTATRQIKVSKEVLAVLRGIQFQPEAPVYEQDEILVTIPVGQYSVESKNVPGSGNMKPWVAHEAVFTIQNEEFRVRYRAGVAPDEEGDFVVARFTANRDFTATSGKTIKKGDTRIFGVNAA